MKHVKFQVPRQTQCEPGPGLADRERGRRVSRDQSTEESPDTNTPTLHIVKNNNKNCDQDASHAGQSVGRNGRRLTEKCTMRVYFE